MHNKITEANVLIASSSLDRPSWQPVADKIADKGLAVTAYESDKVAFGEKHLSIGVDEDGLTAEYDGVMFTEHTFNAAWRRKLNMYLPDQSDWSRQYLVDDERSRMQSILWDTIAESKWLNSPLNIKTAEDKIGQLLTASQVGFNIPKTLITNDWTDINKNLPLEIILKMYRGVIFDPESIKSLYTTKFNNDSELPTDNNPFPGIWQPFLKKAKEWRVTVVGEDIFDAAIYADDDATVDWRRPEYSQSVTFKKEKFPDEYKELCLKFQEHYGLSYGAFDFVEDDDGKITFLECNPNGQFMWLENVLDLKITDSIANQLIKISTKNMDEAIWKRT